MNRGFDFFNSNDNEMEFYRREARESFEAALSKNFWSGLAGLIFGSRGHLLAFDEIIERIPFEGQSDAGVKEIPVNQIVGSTGRSLDFDANFMPRAEHTRQRWIKIATANLNGEYLPPVEVFQVGSVYFVKDGNHRVSVARVMKQESILAHVMEVRIPAELTRQTDLEKAAQIYEREQFYLRTNLPALRPLAQIEPTLPGFYHKMLDHISTHRWFMGMQRNAEVTWEEAVSSWYDTVYSPVVQAIADHRLLAAFPGRSEADLYLWISEYCWYLSQKTQDKINYANAALSFAENTAQILPRLIWRATGR